MKFVLQNRVANSAPHEAEDDGRGVTEFCRANVPAQVERERNGELMVMSSAYVRGERMGSEVGGELFGWAEADGRGHYFGSGTGSALPDPWVCAAHAAWVSW